MQMVPTATPVLLFPAWAGVILAVNIDARVALTFPRVGGGDPVGWLCRVHRGFFSPRGRG